MFISKRKFNRMLQDRFYAGVMYGGFNEGLQGCIHDCKNCWKTKLVNENKDESLNEFGKAFIKFAKAASETPFIGDR